MSFGWAILASASAARSRPRARRSASATRTSSIALFPTISCKYAGLLYSRAPVGASVTLHAPPPFDARCRNGCSSCLRSTSSTPSRTSASCCAIPRFATPHNLASAASHTAAHRHSRLAGPDPRRPGDHCGLPSVGRTSQQVRPSTQQLSEVMRHVTCLCACLRRSWQLKPEYRRI